MRTNRTDVDESDTDEEEIAVVLNPAQRARIDAVLARLTAHNDDVVE